ncbi:hypothetical protein [Candidatus Parabeggiatoa sp. HSG14]|uniref:hypothetical protein n=1 Tax=Candidatus Parabeggiatoa sp. HSG14 TaxID=3055593 RepID=UPI0025A7316C|nr:hypothetical protein [Thiotrichales bacterium HSG14]
MKKIIPLILVFLFFNSSHVDAFWSSVVKVVKIAKISKSSKALPDDEITRLAKLASEVKGTKKVGQVLGKLNLPNDVLEDTYIRIAIQQNKMPRKEAEAMFIRLTGTQGFRTTLSKVIGNNPAGTAGHLNELRIADSATVHGFKVSGIGKKFVDGIKKGPTDIDIVLKNGNKTFAVEAKNYSATTKIPMDKYTNVFEQAEKHPKAKQFHEENIAYIRLSDAIYQERIAQNLTMKQLAEKAKHYSSYDKSH